MTTKANNLHKRLLNFTPYKSTAVAFGASLTVLALSLAMLPLQGSRQETLWYIVLRDVLMVFGVGYCFPLWYVLRFEPAGLQVLGITRVRLGRSLAINAILGGLLLYGMLKVANTPLRLDYHTLCAAAYIVTAGVFETVFFYGFLRHYFARAFGIIPAVMLAAGFYSLHHAGFQPEFGKLLLVGVMYCVVFYLTRNIFIIFPFFWGAGALGDVLLHSDAGLALRNTTTLMVALGLFAAMLLYALWLLHRFCSKQSGGGNSAPNLPQGRKSLAPNPPPVGSSAS